MANVLSASMFFPRGGSATVVRSLARCLPDHGWSAKVVAGSLPGYGHAESFYAGLDLHAVPFAPHGDTPLHPSFEGDEAFPALDEEGFELHVGAWEQHLADAGAADADVLHLHHLTPLNEAAARVAPDLPVVGHLHGTELLMLERIAAGAPDCWPHADEWARRMRGWAHHCAALVVPSRMQLPRVRQLLGIAGERCTIIPNGVDLDLFDRVDIDRAAHWRAHLCEHPKGWVPGGEEGTIAYTPEQVRHVADHTVVLYVGRFTEVKRLGLLVEAWTRAQERFATPASLLVVGGHPGEWEGEHPADAVERTGARNVYLTGWQPQERLPRFLAASDVLVMPSVREQFGMVITEAMACGLPPIAVDAYGPKDIVDHGRTGWLVEPDDRDALAAALVESVNDADERRRRGAAARTVARERYGWGAITRRLASVLEVAAATGRETVTGRELVA